MLRKPVAGGLLDGLSEPPLNLLLEHQGNPSKQSLARKVLSIMTKNLRNGSIKRYSVSHRLSHDIQAGDAPAKAAPPPPPPKRTINPAPTPTQQVPSVPAPAATATPPAPSQNAIAHTPAKPPTPRTAGPTLLPAGLPPSRPSSVRPPPSQKEDSLEALLASRPASGAKGPKKSRSRYVDVMNKK